MDRAATAEPPLSVQAAVLSRAGQAAPLDGALAAIPLGEEGIARSTGSSSLPRPFFSSISRFRSEVLQTGELDESDSANRGAVTRRKIVGKRAALPATRSCDRR
jgi:hypothetical protein